MTSGEEQRPEQRPEKRPSGISRSWNPSRGAGYESSFAGSADDRDASGTLPGAEKKGGGSSGGRLRRIVGDVLSAMTSKGRGKKSQEEYEKWSEEQWEAEALDAKGSYDAFVEEKRKKDQAQRDRVDAARYAPSPRLLCSGD